jgi:hypothetical protein
MLNCARYPLAFAVLVVLVILSYEKKAPLYYCHAEEQPTSSRETLIVNTPLEGESTANQQQDDVVIVQNDDEPVVGSVVPDKSTSGTSSNNATTIDNVTIISQVESDIPADHDSNFDDDKDGMFIDSDSGNTSVADEIEKSTSSQNATEDTTHPQDGNQESSLPETTDSPDEQSTKDIDTSHTMNVDVSPTLGETTQQQQPQQQQPADSFNETNTTTSPEGSDTEENTASDIESNAPFDDDIKLDQSTLDAPDASSLPPSSTTEAEYQKESGEGTLENGSENPTSETSDPEEQDYIDLDAFDGTNSNYSSSRDQKQINDSDSASIQDSTSVTSAAREEIPSRDSGSVEELTASTTTQGNEKAPPKEGSLASFFEKVKRQESDLSGESRDGEDTGSIIRKPYENTPQLQQAKGASSNEYKGWGYFRGKRRNADLYILGLLFDKNLADEAAARYNKVFEPLDNLVIPKLYTEVMGTESLKSDKSDGSDSASSPIEKLKGRLSPNAEFVEGLDDLDKFFEGVDPPDELDVGAGGSSIQEVLMGQTSKIIFKRVVLGSQYVGKTVKAVSKRIHEYFADEKRELPKVNKEQFTRAGKWAVEKSRSLWENARFLFEDLFGGDDDFDESMDEFANYSNDLQKRLMEMTAEK